MDANLKYWLAMLRTPGVGSKTARQLLSHLSPEQIFAAPISQLKAIGISEKVALALQTPNWAGVEADLKWLEHPNNHAITLDDLRYPPRLKEIYDPPPILFVKGKPELLTHRQLAMVGSRNPSGIGRQTAFDFAKTLSEHGLTITSGMALGIDAASHEGTLKANGYTIAVAGTGLDRVYPASHKPLAVQIAETGAIISEFPTGVTAIASNFPRRNRIISGLCLGLLVVEAARDSGSLITARLALEQNREVFAIPGSIHNPLARGCNALIRQGAKLVESCDDIFEELGQYNQTDSKINSQNTESPLDLAQQNLLNLIPYSPIPVDYLVSESQLPVESVSALLLMLELQGYIATAVGGTYLRIK